MSYAKANLDENDNGSVCAVISSVSPGGAEYTFVEVVRELVREGRAVTVITLKGVEPNELLLPAGVVRRSCSSAARRSNWFGRVANGVKVYFRLRKLLKENPATFTLSFMAETNLMVLATGRAKCSSVVVCERIHPEYAPYLSNSFLGPVLKFVRNGLYSSAARIVVQSKEMFSSFPKRFQGKLVSIPNFVRSFPGDTVGSISKSKRILSIGRLVPQKDHSSAISAFLELHQKSPDWKLSIIGDGPLQEKLARQIRNSPCPDSIDLLPFSRELESHYREASILLSTSRFEGFPNVIVEAMLFGLAVIALDCPGATSEILGRENSHTAARYGVLVEMSQAKSLGEALCELAENPQNLSHYSKMAKEGAARYTRSGVIAQWANLFK